MKQAVITYSDGDQTLIGELIYDENKKEKQAAVIVFPAFEGIGEFAIEYAKTIVAQGYVAFVADIYGDGQVANTIEGCFKLITPFLQDRSLVRRRSRLAFDCVINQAMVDSNKVGAIGFCFGGMCGMELVRSGADLKAMVSVHGVLQKSDLPNKKMNSRILVLHGFKDPQVPPQAVIQFEDEMNAAGIEDWRLVFFGNAKHSFTDPKTGAFDAAKEAEMGREYNKIAADASYRYAIEFFAEVF